MYEWGLDETGELLTDLMEENDANTPNDYELGQVILIRDEVMPGGQPPNSGKEMAEGEETVKTRAVKPLTVFEVSDGQQRLVTLSLVFAAIRDEAEARRESAENEEDQDRASDLRDEIQKRLYFNPKRKSKNSPPCTRVTLRGDAECHLGAASPVDQPLPPQPTTTSSWIGF